MYVEQLEAGRWGLGDAVAVMNDQLVTGIVAFATAAFPPFLLSNETQS